jgi:hypothetical protein
MSTGITTMYLRIEDLLGFFDEGHPTKILGLALII